MLYTSIAVMLGFFAAIEVYNIHMYFKLKELIRHYLQHVYILYSLSALPVEYIVSFNIDNRKTRSRLKLKMCTTTNVLILYIFSSFVYFCDLRMAHSGQNMSSA